MTGPAHLVPEYPSDRGFKWMPALPSAYNLDDASVRLIESSLADGPHVAVILERKSHGRPGELPAADVMVPLDADKAWQLREQLDWLLEHHYQGDARPPSETLRPSPDATTADLIVALSDEVTRLTARASQVEAAARRLLDGCTPQVSALELEHGVSADDLYGDLAEALGLPRDYRPEDA